MKFTFSLTCLVATAAVAQPLPEKALKYHEAFLKRPHYAALFDRLFGAWRCRWSAANSDSAESEIPEALIYEEKLIATSHDPYQKTLRQLRRADLLTRAARVMGKAAYIPRRDLRRLGDGQGVRQVNGVIVGVLGAIADWSRHAADHGLSKAITGSVGRQHGLAG